MFQFPDAMSAEAFLDRYWQKTHLFMPQALPADLPELSAEELAWLATLEDVESRIVFSERNGDTTGYRVEHGPFDEKTLEDLPPENWTLLVQDVEKHLPDFRRFIQAASFIPDWRIDDLMVIFAAPGGSVGPHRDNYDVFLCQGVGQREWRLAPPDADLKPVESAGLSLLEPFADDTLFTSISGDVLYLPPGIAHWGIAADACLTYSIGMRAPTLAEFVAAVSRIQNTEVGYDNDVFYADPDLAISESEPGLISDAAIRRARKSFAMDIDISDEDFTHAFGSVVTDVKAWLSPDEPGAAEIQTILADGPPSIRAHGMARFAYHTAGDQDLVFLNGHSRSVNTNQVNCFRRICTDRVASVSDDELFRWLLAHGAFDLQTDERIDAT